MEIGDVVFGWNVCVCEWNNGFGFGDYVVELFDVVLKSWSD